MQSRFHAARVWLATGISLWMAVLACFLGCAMPALANGGSPRMADMENCHHSGQAPAKPMDGKSAPGQPMSCCPLEITVAPKPHAITIGIAPADLAVAGDLSLLAKTPFYFAAELVPSLWHSGRDTLLKTRLLRI